jgi:hypothetical protein
MAHNTAAALGHSDRLGRPHKEPAGNCRFRKQPRSQNGSLPAHTCNQYITFH